MTDKEFRKLSRADLVDIIYQLQQDKQELIEENKQLKENMAAEKEKLMARLRSREIRVAKAGSLADAAVSLMGLLERAQATADIYIENISEMKAEEEKKLEVIREMYSKAKKNVAASSESSEGDQSNAFS